MRDGELMPVPLKAGAVVLVGTFALVDDTGFAVASTAAIAATQKLWVLGMVQQITQLVKMVTF